MKIQFFYWRRSIDGFVILIGGFIKKFIGRLIRRLIILSALTIITLPAYGSGRLQYFLTGEGVSNGAQEVNFRVFEDRTTSPDTKNGNAFLYDSRFGRGGAFSMDYYSLSETYNYGNPRPAERNEFYMLSLGYRHHLPFDFYLGAAGGIIVVEHNYLNDRTSFLPTFTPAITFGWTYVSPIKLAFGIHFLRTSATKLTSTDAFTNRLTSLAGSALCDENNIDPISGIVPINQEDCDQLEDDETTEVDNFNMNLFGITVGFAW